MVSPSEKLKMDKSDTYNNNTQLIATCKKLAQELHEGQTRDNGVPYIMHPNSVSSVCFEYVRAWYKTNLDTCGQTDDEIDNTITTISCAALLHDVLEDCNITYDELVAKTNKTIADIVRELTNDPNTQNKHASLLEKAKTFSNEAKIIKLADRFMNVSESLMTDTWTISRTKSYAKKGLELIDAMHPLPEYAEKLETMVTGFLRKIV